MRLAIDSYPLNNDIHKTYDYSGLQILSLGHKPLFKSAESVRRDRNILRVKLARNEAPEFLKSFESFGRKNSLIRKTAFKGVRKAWASNDELCFEVENDFDSRNFRIPNIAIERPRAATRVTLVNSPYHNHALYEAGDLDFLCDTAVRLEAVDDSYDNSWTGLIGSLDYSLRFKSLPCFKDMNRLLSGYRPAKRFDPLNPLRDGDEKQSLSLAKRPERELIIAYDDFYPNRDIALDVAAYLEKHGVESRVVADNYYSPRIGYDLKFVINRPLGDSLIYHWLWLFNFSGAKEELTRKIILTNIKKRKPFSLNEVSGLGLGRALFKIPSFRKKTERNNPLHGLLGDLYELDIR